MKKILLIITIIGLTSFANAQTYVYNGCFACGAFEAGDQSGSIISDDKDNSNIIIFQDLYDGKTSIGKIDSTGNEIWEKSYTSPDSSMLFFYLLSIGRNNEFYTLGMPSFYGNDTSKQNILSSLTSTGLLKWTEEFNEYSINDLGGMSFNNYSSRLIVYGYDSTGIKIINFDTNGTSNWSLSIHLNNYINSCLPLMNGNFLFNVLDSNAVIVFELDTLGNILNSNSYLFNHKLSNTQLLAFKNNYILAAEDTSNSGECYLMFCDSFGHVIHANKIELNNFTMRELLQWNNSYINLITTRNDSIFTVNADTTGMLINIQYSGYLAHSSSSHFGSGTGLDKAITNKQGILFLESAHGWEDAGSTFYWDAIPISQLDSTGRSCSNNITINQTLQVDTFSILTSPVTLPAIISHITVWNDSLTFTQGTPSFDKGCGGFVNITNLPQEIQSVILYPNPADDYIIIESPQSAVIEIINLQGQTILQQQLQQGKIEIDISGFAKGVYILRLSSNDKTAVTKIVKE